MLLSQLPRWPPAWLSYTPKRTFKSSPSFTWSFFFRLKPVVRNQLSKDLVSIYWKLASQISILGSLIWSVTTVVISAKIILTAPAPLLLIGHLLQLHSSAVGSACDGTKISDQLKEWLCCLRPNSRLSFKESQRLQCFARYYLEQISARLIVPAGRRAEFLDFSYLFVNLMGLLILIFEIWFSLPESQQLYTVCWENCCHCKRVSNSTFNIGKIVIASLAVIIARQRKKYSILISLRFC